MSADLMVPSAQHVDGARVLDDLRGLLDAYVVLPSRAAADAVVLWIAATHAVGAFEHATRLVIKSPEKRCGKTRLLEVIAETCHLPLMTVNATVAAVFRSLGGDRPPTLLMDEADAIFGTKIKAEQNEDMRALLNAGFDRNRPALRTVGPNHTPTEFATFAMAALAGIGSMPDTIEDRAVIITMRRRAPGETVQPYRTRRDRPLLNQLRDRLAVWADFAAATLADAEPATDLEDRAADTWEPLLAVADAAGGHWPTRARAASAVLADAAAAADVDRNLGAKMLADCRVIFADSGAEFIASADLVQRLRAVEDAPWSDFDLTSRRLAARLKNYGVHVGHDAAKTSRGYKRTAFADAWSRYLPTERPETSERPDPAQVRGFATDASKSPDDSIRPDDDEASEGFLADIGPSDARTERDARTAVPGNPLCQMCGKPNLFAPQTIARGICAACIKVLDAKELPA
jgi:hypothetical protein